MTRYILLAASVLTSAFLLVVFLRLQANSAPQLSLETRWIALALLPVAVALVVGRFIQRFKGFGIELETHLTARGAAQNIAVSDALNEVLGAEKRSLDYLYSMSPEGRLSIGRLAFRISQPGTYFADAVQEYLENLPNLKYIEIRTNEGRFDCLLPAKRFVVGGNVSFQEVERLVDAVHENAVRKQFPEDHVSTAVAMDDSLLGVLPKARQVPQSFLPVVNSAGLLVGVLTSADIERQIASEVLRAHARAQK